MTIIGSGGGLVNLVVRPSESRSNQPFNPDKVNRAIEKLRFAQLQVFKCELHREPGQGKDADKVREELQSWETFSAEEIIEKFVKENSSAQ